MSNRPSEAHDAKNPSAIGLLLKGQPKIRSYLVRVKRAWQRIQCTYQVMGRREERKIAEEAMPILRTFNRGSCSIGAELRAAYKEYTDNVSYEGMPISFESACFLWSLCEALKPQRILDMGSGFSSFVFRRYQCTATPTPEVWSVDESPEWLEKTRIYLHSQSLSDDHLYSWDHFQRLEPERFDVIMHDLGLMSDRPDIFDRMLELLEDSGVVVVDDLHHPWYRGEIRRRIGEHDKLAGYSLKWLTLDRFLRYCLLVGRRPVTAHWS